MPDANEQQPLTRADLERFAEALATRQERATEAIIGNISDLREEMNRRFETIERRTERMEITLNALLMQTAGMSKSLTDAERIDSALTATQAAQQRAIDQLAQRVARIERELHPGPQ